MYVKMRNGCRMMRMAMTMISQLEVSSYCRCTDVCVYTCRRIGVGVDGVEDRGGNGGNGDGGGTAALSRDINQDCRSMAMVLILSQ